MLTRNFKTDRGEIDLVCRLGNTLVFVEVRARSSAFFGRPAESIDERKGEALQETSLQYLRLLERDDVPHRFDAVEVRLETGQPPVCELVTNIFGACGGKG